MLLPNTPETNLTIKNDYLGLIPKAQAIKYFFDNIDESRKFKLLALYGDWGSGKTSLLLYLKKELDKKYYNTFFFEAWKYEKDDNLALSLIDLLTTQSKTVLKSVIDEFKSASFSFLKGFSKSLSFGIPGMTITPGNIILQLEDDIKYKESQYSYYKSLEKFNAAYLEFEKSISKKQINIVFIDDLDRCEPENVLNLLAAIKLFFTYGEKTIFLCGLDKNAVSSAVKVRYGDVIKSDEYLEKVFDFSFNMPHVFYLKKFVFQYFPNKTSFAGKVGDTSTFISNFFQSIKFDNPRRLKKVLNKYEILCKYKSSLSIYKSEKNLIPRIIDNGSGNLTEIILTLFSIILYEFYPTAFEMISNNDKKNSLIIDQIFNYTNLTLKGSRSKAYGQAKRLRSFGFYKSSLKSFIKAYKGNVNSSLPGQEKVLIFKQLIFLFTPTDVDSINTDCSIEEFIGEFVGSKQDILLLFCSYINNNQFLFIDNIDASDYRIKDFYKMVKTLL